MQRENQPNQAVVCPALGSSHGSGDPKVFGASSAADSIVKKVPLLGPWVHPSRFVLVNLPEEGVSNGQVVFSTEAQKRQAIAVYFAHVMWAYHAFPASVVSATSSIEVTQQDEFVCSTDVLHKPIEILVKGSLASGLLVVVGVDADDCDMV